MSDKQRADHVQAKYWNGFLTRTEAQKVFDETAKVIQAQQRTLAQMDAVLSFFAEKLDVKPDDVQAWIMKKHEEAQKSSLEKAVEAKEESQLVAS